jgi:hypothetical protein
MFAMSVNEVPGWLVTIPPSAIGVPVAVTPAFGPHCEVATVVLLEPAELADEVLLGLLAGELPHPAAATIPNTPTMSAAFFGQFEARLYIRT